MQMGKSRTRLYLFSMIVISVFVLGTMVQAKEVKEHPLIRPFPGSVLAKNMSKYNRFNAFDFYYTNEETQKREKKKVKGEYYKLLYEVRNASGGRVQDISTVEFFENYRNAAIEKGGKVVYEDSGSLVFTLPREDGGTTWCRVSVSANLGQQYVVIVDEKGMKQSMTFGPKALKDALDKDGRVLLYGILFDLDKAILKRKSVEQLMHIVTLMQTAPDLYLEVQGHTDNQGSDEYNMKLSRERAVAVCTYLQLFGVEPSHLVPKGYGETKPVAPNETNEGRAKNRRVELVKIMASQAKTDQRHIQAQPVKATTAAPMHKEVQTSALETIEGKWQMTPNKRVKAGTMTFNNNNTYLMVEDLQDGDRVSKKGEYRIDKQTSPPRIDICLMKCGTPGSEYTTSFGIYRFLPDGRLEIRSSPDGKYPTGFGDTPLDGYTMVMKRIE